MEELRNLTIKEVNFEHIFDVSPDLICILDRDQNIIRANQALADRLGKSNEDLFRTKCYQCVHQTDGPPGFCVHIQMLKDGLGHTSEVFIETLNGWFSVSVTPLFNDKNEIIGSIHIARDITERKKVEREIKESEENFRVLFEESSIGIVATDLKTHHFLFSNPAICAMFQYSLEEFLMLEIADLHPKDSVKDVVSEFDSQLKGNKALSSTLSCVRKDGSVFYADIVGTSTIINGRKCSVGFFTDVTKRVLAEEALKKKSEELKNFNSYFIDRELKMIELKKEINDLLKKSGEKEKYVIH